MVKEQVQFLTAFEVADHSHRPELPCLAFLFVHTSVPVVITSISAGPLESKGIIAQQSK